MGCEGKRKVYNAGGEIFSHTQTLIVLSVKYNLPNPDVEKNTAYFNY